MVNLEVVRTRLSQLETSLSKLERYRSMTFDEYMKEDVVRDVVEYNLFISINMISDLAQHIVADHRLGKPETLGDAFQILSEHQYMEEDDVQVYRKMMGLRNILSHEYTKRNDRIIFDVMRNHLKDLKKFILFINEKFI